MYFVYYINTPDQASIFKDMIGFTCYILATQLTRDPSDDEMSQTYTF